MTSDPATSTVSAAAPPSLGAGAAASTVQGPPVSEQERTIDQETLTDHGGPPLSGKQRGEEGRQMILGPAHSCLGGGLPHWVISSRDGCQH